MNKAKLFQRFLETCLFIGAMVLVVMPAAIQAASFELSAELGAGIRHNHGGAGLFVRGVVLSQNGSGCGIILGSWEGDFENDVAGLTCEKRFFSGEKDRPVYSMGVGVVDIEPSPIVNSDWALEAHFRFFLSEHFAMSFTHFSNAGTHSPNRGHNFISAEFLF